MTAQYSHQTPPDEGGLTGEQPFMSHLVELRDRLLRMVVAILLVFVVLFPFGNDIYTFIAEPIRAQLPEGAQMIATQVASPFLTPFKLALISAVFVAMPYLLYQLWAFVAPGLYTHEKRLAVPLLASSIVLFYLGMSFAYFVVFPLVFGFFTSVTPEGVTQMPDIAFYLEFVLKLFFAFGLAFEIPIATILLVAIGATTPAALARKRPYVVVGVFVLGMLLTPPDVISQTLLAIPMWLLFELGIFASRMFIKPRSGDAAEDDVTPAPEPAGGAPARAAAASTVPDYGPPSTSEMVRQGFAGSSTVGADIDGGRRHEPGRYRPMTEEEMEAEFDAIDAEEDRVEGARGAASDSAPELEPEELDDVDESAPDMVQVTLEQAAVQRARGNAQAARQLLYRVLEDGDDDQRMVARNILMDLDSD